MTGDPLAPCEDVPLEIREALGGRVPTCQQWAAISHPPSARAVVAGAGSGKTAVMAARIVWLVLEKAAGREGASPGEILCLTFTNKAAEELAGRVRRAIAPLGLPEGEESTVMTYHSFGQRILSDYGARMGFERGRLLTEAHRWQIVASLLAERTFEHLEVRHLPTVMKNCLTLNDQCADHLVTPEDVIESCRRAPAGKRPSQTDELLAVVHQRRELASLVADYQRRKADIGAFDFGDLIALANRLVEEHPAIAEEFRARFRAVLLDEYQDTNIAQARLLRSLCGPGYPVFAVGDPDQNIYAWRGASLVNLLRFGEDFGAAGDSLPLYLNFRSGSHILRAADAVIAPVPPERRAADKVLHPRKERGTGRVVAFVESDERAEAARMASLIREAVDQGRAWSDVAILCRKKRLFAPIAEVLRDEGIPVEVVDLGGLLALPEIVDVVAWLRVLEDPGRSVELARILQGPRWRIGYRDLVGLARWSGRRTRALRGELPEDDESPGDVGFALSEALDHIDDPEMTEVSDEARERLREFSALLAGLRARSGASLADLVSEIADRTGLHGELASQNTAASISKLRNLTNFGQFVAAFAPVAGEATLATLNAYLDTAGEVDDDLEPAQPSEADTVKMLTVHKAKGLEWPVVFVPGLAVHSKWANSWIFPSNGRHANPLAQAKTLPFELRGDAEVLPAYGGDPVAFKKVLEDRTLEEERRLCYVALTRAKDVLVASAAHWYGGVIEHHVPGPFYEEIAAQEHTEVVFQAPFPEENPLIALRAGRATEWPPPARADDRDDVFPEGWRAAAVSAATDPSVVASRVANLAPAAAAEYQEQLSLHLERAGLISERTAPDSSVAVPAQVGATALIEYLRCPKSFYWSSVRPLPRRPSSAARVGTEVHRWIEIRSRGRRGLFEDEDGVDLEAGERRGEAPSVARLRDAFTASRFAASLPLYAERAFLLVLEGFVVSGRIDAIFGTPDGPWEIVDYKTGRVPDEGDALSGVQLDVYALAAQKIWGKKPEELTLTYFYLGEPAEVSRPAGDPAAAETRVVEALRGIAAGRFEPVPGRHCGWCDFLTFCDAGRREMREGAGTR